MQPAFLRISDDVKLGRDVRIFAFVNLYGCQIDDESKIGTFVEIQKGAKIGKHCKISSHTFICEGVTIDDGVFVVELENAFGAEGIHHDRILC